MEGEGISYCLPTTPFQRNSTHLAYRGRWKSDKLLCVYVCWSKVRMGGDRGKENDTQIVLISIEYCAYRIYNLIYLVYGLSNTDISFNFQYVSNLTHIFGDIHKSHRPQCHWNERKKKCCCFYCPYWLSAIEYGD